MNLLFKLEELRKLDVISMLEVEFVRFLMSIIPDEKEEVLLAAAACVHAQINGHVCLDIENLKEEYVFNDAKSGIKLTKSIKQQWLQNLEESELVSYGNELKPLVLENGRLYLHRYWKYEEELSDWLRKKSASQNAISEESNKVINSLFPAKADLFETNWQQIAVCLSFLKDLLVISGGPGTGKTYTVLNIITAHMLAHPEQPMRIALAAPTGKAARRLADSIEEGKKNLPEELRSKHEIPTSALTVHKLLGSGYRSSHFRFNEENKLPFDIVIIDEASMLDITMWVRLIRAIGPNTKLVVLGDKDQLASV
ncbi:MAG: AAA family ATPase, partial [Gracilimonas sp.]